MIRSVAVAISFLALGCAAGTSQVVPSAPAQPAPPPTTPSTVAGVLEDGKEVTPGWEQLPQEQTGIPGLVLRNSNTRAVITISLFPSAARSLRDVGGELFTRLSAGGADVADLETSADGDQISFLWSRDDAQRQVRGKAVVKRLSPATGLSVAILGSWLVEHDAAMLRDFDILAAGIGVR